MSRTPRAGMVVIAAGVLMAGCLPQAKQGAASTPANLQPNAAPTIGGSPVTSAVSGTEWQFTPTAQDADGDALQFTATGLPGWISLNPQSGRISGVPTPGDVGTTGPIVIRVSDGEASASLAAFSITVVPAVSEPPPPTNRAPSISGSPPTSGVIGTEYVFAPTASDPDGDPLSWSISGKPTTAAFNPSTGRLTWTPAAAGTWTGILISVTDAHGATASLPAFSITVGAGVAASASLSWSAPVQYTNGANLPQSDLAAYRIFHGTSAANLTRVAEVDGRTNAFTVTNLGAGTHYFAVTAVSVEGAESPYSAVGSKTIN